MNGHHHRQSLVERAVILAAVLLPLIAGSPAEAQFTTVINVPPSIAPNSIGSNTQLNLSSTGVIPSNFDAGASNGSSVNVEVNIASGTVGLNLDAYNGSTINITGGLVTNGFSARSGSVVNISGGAVATFFDAENGSTINIAGGGIGDRFRTVSGSAVRIRGNDFRINGVPIDGLGTVGDAIQLDVASEAVLTGVLADGMSFLISSSMSSFDLDVIAAGTLTLEAVELPTFIPQVFTASTHPLPVGVRAGQTLIVDAGSFVGDNYNAAPGSTLQVQPGGTVASNLEAVGAVVNIAGGNVDYGLDAAFGTVVNVSGGSVGHDLDAFDGSIVNISGGTVGNSFQAYGGSQINILGGSVGDGFSALANSSVTIAGGALGGFFNVLSGSAVRLVGNDFRLNGQPIPGLNSIGNSVAVDIPSGAAFTGFLSDGQPFMFSSDDSDHLASGTLTLEAANLPAVQPGYFVASAGAVPISIGAGQTLVVDASAAVHSASPGSTLEIHAGGSVGVNLEAVGAAVNINGGNVGQEFDAGRGTVVNLIDGSIKSQFQALDGSLVNISGGTIAWGFQTLDGSVVNMSGGQVFASSFGSILLEEGSLLNLYARDLALDGEEIMGLVPGEPFILTDRTGLLTGVLADGSSFFFPLTNQVGGRTGPRRVNGVIALNLVADMLMGDFNHDGQVNTADYTTWRNSSGESVTPGFGADGNFDGRIDRGDYYVWKRHFGPAAGAALTTEDVPEPASALLAALVASAFIARRPLGRNTPKNGHPSRPPPP